MTAYLVTLVTPGDPTRTIVLHVQADTGVEAWQRAQQQYREMTGVWPVFPVTDVRREEAA